MTPFEPRFTEDVKDVSTAPAPKDVEGGVLPPPSYPLHETEELAVGGRGHRWRHWFRSRRHGRGGCCRRSAEADEGPRGHCKKLSKVVRAFKFIFVTWLLFHVVQWTVTAIDFHRAHKSLKCMPVTPSEYADALTVTVPLGSEEQIYVHDSLSGGDSSITHDSSVEKGTVQFSVTFGEVNGTKQDTVYDGCVARFKHATSVGLIPREKGAHARAKISAFSIRVPTSYKSPSVNFIGSGNKHVSDSKLRKIIRFWRKQQGKKARSNTRKGKKSGCKKHMKIAA